MRTFYSVSLLLIGLVLHGSLAGPPSREKRAAIACDAITGALSLADASSASCTLLGAATTATTRPQLVLSQGTDAQLAAFASTLDEIRDVDIVLDGSTTITKLNFPKLTKLDKSHVIAKDNPSLTEIVMDKLTGNVKLTGLTISNNPSLVKVKMEGSTYFSIESGTITITDNKALTTVDIPVDTKFPGVTAITIKGNRQLKQDSLDKFGSTSVANASIQKEGDCSFPEEITNLAELTGCKRVDGPLTISNGATGDVDGQLDEVTGEIKLGKLAESKLGFLEGTNVSKISGGNCGVKVKTNPPYQNTDPNCVPADSNVIALVGGCVGAVVLIAVIAIGLYILCKRMKAKKKLDGKNDKKSEEGGDGDDGGVTGGDEAGKKKNKKGKKSKEPPKGEKSGEKPGAPPTVLSEQPAGPPEQPTGPPEQPTGPLQPALDKPDE